MANVRDIAIRDIVNYLKDEKTTSVEWYSVNGKPYCDVWVYSPYKMRDNKEIQRLNAELGLKSINNFQKRK